MANRAVILLNDTTDHGGKVIIAVGGYTYKGIPIVESSDNLKNNGKAIPVEGMHTACGTKLIASQKEFLA
ncbi:PAAR domain-containing protein [Xenorhabdus griffiniae]|uniref:PAAR domain-containing protein n=1 Tax=Xenorhabdus griffiniae TaxID=351672 RepID=UPI002359B642|nr:PAAR domain-containing protein [Xenorhabdus griffiniae]MDC9606949.1 PAAR domain-containing protein [Xenorhabdus griffiniae]